MSQTSVADAQQQQQQLARPIFREKILHMYDILFSGSDEGRDSHFWEDFFLLKPRPSYLSDLLTTDNLSPVEKKFVIHKLSAKCVECLHAFQRDHSSSARASFNAIVVYSLLLQDLPRTSLDDLLYTPPSFPTDSLPATLFQSLHFMLSESEDAQLLKCIFRLLIRLISTGDELFSNPYLPYFMAYSFFDAFMRMIGDPLKRVNVGGEVVALLGILPHYSLNEPESNPYMQLSVLDPSMEMMGIAAVIGEGFRISSKLFFQKVIALQKDNTWMSWITKPMTRVQPPVFSTDHRDAMLLALFTGLQIGRNFVHAFTHAQSEILVAPHPSTPTPSSPTDSTNTFVLEPAVVTPKNDSTDEPSNLFVEFLQYASIVLQFIKEDRPNIHAKMSLLILCTITEDHYTTQSLHDFTINYRVHFYRSTSRYHPSQIMCSQKPEPLACAVLNLISEFISSHMRAKHFPDDLYLRCLLIIYRLMDYQKRTRFRLPYQWKTLWSSLLSLLKFLEGNEATLNEEVPNYFLLCTQVVNILNIFLIGGDAILSQVGSYDDLCYEIVRSSAVINNIYAMGLRCSAASSPGLQNAAKKFLNALTNLRAVVIHFSAHVEAFSTESRKVTMEREEILAVIQKNYDTLNLRLVDMTDCFEKSAVVGKDQEFIAGFLRAVLLDLRQVYVVSECLDAYIGKTFVDTTTTEIASS